MGTYRVRRRSPFIFNSSRCTICRSVVEMQVTQAICLGFSMRWIGRRFGFSHTTVWRHKTRCIPPREIRRALDYPY